jgi:OOP family OmpA-OmpF porin
MKKIILIAGVLLALCTNVYAADKNVKQMGVYLGATVGATKYDDDGAVTDSNFDDEDYLAQIIAGYKFNKYFALDARYVDLGNYSDSSGKVDITAWSGNVVGSYPFTNSGWEAFGQLGYGRLTGDSNCCGKDTENTATAGLGIRWSLNRHLSFSGQLDTWQFRVNGDDRNYTQYISALSAGIQYVFE